MKPCYKYFPPFIVLLFIPPLLFSFPLVWAMFNQGFVCNSNVLFELLFGAYFSHVSLLTRTETACVRVFVFMMVFGCVSVCVFTQAINCDK